MTCIIAFSHNDKVYMAGERGHSDSSILAASKQPKIFKINDYLLGYSGATGQGQLIAYRFSFPSVPRAVDVNEYMVSEIAPLLRTFYQSYEINTDKEEDCADFIVGVKGRVFEISSYDFQCVEYDITAIGSGREYALGAYHAISQYEIDPEQILRTCVEAAIEYSPSCKDPIDILVS